MGHDRDESTDGDRTVIMTEALGMIPGWFGKLPALGDFASRRLPQNFTQTWDDWLSAGLQSSRVTLGETWLDAFLRAPLWSFALLPGVIDPSCWCGVMMPSVDRAGRYFPLTIVAPFEAPPADAVAIARLQVWLNGLKRAALATLDDGHTTEQLEQALAVLGAPQAAPRPAAAPNDHGGWPFDGEDLVRALTQPALAGFWRECSGETLWWSDTSPRVRRVRGLPPAGDFHSWLARID